MFTMHFNELASSYFIAIFLGIETCSAFSLEAAEKQNSSIYEKLRKIAESSYFSQINIGLDGACPRNASKCSAASCSISKTTLKDGSGLIDLLKTREAYSPTAAKGSAEVWEDLYNIIGDDQLLWNVVSGLRFSISTHIAAFYTNILGYYFSNPKLFQRRYNKAYKDNFLLLYAILRTGVASLVNNPTDIKSEAIDLSMHLINDNEKETMRKLASSRPFGSSQFSGVSDVTNIDDIYVDSAYIDKITELLGPLACLSCSKCLLWGTIQIRGLRAAVKSINNAPLTKLDLICLINAFRRASVTMVESRRLERVKHTFLWFPITYHYQIIFVVCSSLYFCLLYLKTRKVAHL